MEEENDSVYPPDYPRIPAFEIEKDGFDYDELLLEIAPRLSSKEKENSGSVIFNQAVAKKIIRDCNYITGQRNTAHDLDKDDREYLRIFAKTYYFDQDLTDSEKLFFGRYSKERGITYDRREGEDSGRDK